MTEDSHFRLRLPSSLKERVQQAAEENHRSINAEVVARLEASFGNIVDPFTPLQERTVRKMFDSYLADMKNDVIRRLDELERMYTADKPNG